MPHSFPGWLIPQGRTRCIISVPARHSYLKPVSPSVSARNRNSLTFLRGKVAVFSQQCRGLFGSEYAAATLNTADPPAV